MVHKSCPTFRNYGFNHHYTGHDAVARETPDHDGYASPLCRNCPERIESLCAAETYMYASKAHRDAGIPHQHVPAALVDEDATTFAPILNDLRRLLASTWGALILIGDYGVGKSYLASAILRHITSPRRSAAWLDCSQAAADLSNAYALNTVGAWKAPYIAAHVLVLDGYGDGGNMRPDVRLALDEIIMARAASSKRPVIITTNLAVPALQAVCSGAVWDRLRVGGVHALTGASRRGAQQKEVAE